MREIKFRGQCLDGKWVYGMLAHAMVKVGNVDPGYYISNSAGRPFAYAVRPETVGQYTGLKDKNGKEIWEDDVMFVPETDFNAEIIGRVVYEDDSYYIIPLHGGHLWGLHWSIRKHNAKIIGNRFDNPELLK